MSSTYDQLKALLEKQGTLSEADIQKMVEAHGPMTPEEQTQIAAAIHEKARSSAQKISLEDYLAASKVLDTAPEGSEEYQRALKIVEAYESGG